MRDLCSSIEKRVEVFYSSATDVGQKLNGGELEERSDLFCKTCAIMVLYGSFGALFVSIQMRVEFLTHTESKFERR